MYFKGYHKEVTRIRVLTRTTRKISIFGRKETLCLSRESLVNLTLLDHIIPHTYRMLTGEKHVHCNISYVVLPRTLFMYFLSRAEDILGVTCHRAMPPGRICTIDIVVVSSLLIILREHHLTRGATVTRQDRKLTQPPCNSRQRLASLPRPRSLQLRHHIPVRKITIDKNKQVLH